MLANQILVFSIVEIYCCQIQSSHKSRKKSCSIKFPWGPFTEMEKQGIKEGGVKGGGKGIQPRMLDKIPKETSTALTLQFYFNQLFSWYLLPYHLVWNSGLSEPWRKQCAQERVKGRLSLKSAI